MQNKLAVVILILKDNKVLAVSRKNDPNAFGLPGGKVDPGEYLEQAAARELLEETGLVATNLTPVFVHEEEEYSTTTFTCDYSGDINTPETGVVKWVEPDVLFSGPFGKYNLELFTELKLVPQTSFYKTKTTRTLPSGATETTYALTDKASKQLELYAEIPAYDKNNH